jgi:hypothetical protein
VLVQAWLNISSMSLKETGEGGLSSGVFLKNGCFNTQNNVPMLNRTNIPMLLRASYQNFRKQCADGSLSTDPASDIGLDRYRPVCDSSSLEPAFYFAYPAGEHHISIHNCKSTANSISCPHSSMQYIFLSWDYVNNNMTMTFDFWFRSNRSSASQLFQKFR